jgi:ASC-1-like (ASCH) protein
MENMDKKYHFKEVKEPHLGNLILGSKTVEGRLYEPFSVWTEIKIGDYLVMFPNRYNMCINCHMFEVIGLYRADTFADLYRIFGEKLLPGIKTVDDCINLYYTVGYNDSCTIKEYIEKRKNDEKKYGVIGVEVKYLRPYSIQM